MKIAEKGNRGKRGRTCKGLMACMMAILLLAGAGGTALAAQADQAAGQASKKLTIEVVEEIPAVEIEDEAVPLAAGPGKETKNAAPLVAAACVAAAGGLTIGLARRRKSLMQVRLMSKE